MDSKTLEGKILINLPNLPMFVTDIVLHYIVCACACTYIRSVYSCFSASNSYRMTDQRNAGGASQTVTTFSGDGHRLGDSGSGTH